MPFVSGFLRVRRRGHPGHPLPPGEGGPVDPDYGVDEGSPPSVWPPLPDIDPPEPPPGVWPPLTPEHPWRPIPSLPERPSTGPVPPQPGPGQPLPRPPGSGGTPEHPIAPPPGTIWPPLPPGVTGKYWALVAIGGMPGGVVYRYVVVDAGLRPDQSLPRPPARPDQGLPPVAEPKPV